MQSLELWEVVRILAYMFGVVAVVLAVLGMVIASAAFGTNGPIYSVINLFGTIFFRGGMVCGTVSAVMVAMTSDLVVG